jgi:hypothetical protein
MPKLHEFETLKAAEERHQQFERLGRRPFSIFQMATGTWAFWTN